MAQANAALRLRQERAHQPDRRDGDKRIAPGDIQLQEALGLHSVPETIECFDISSFQGREAVGSLVYFRRGLPLKSRYRRFRIREVTGSNDFAMLQEVLGRYYGRLAGRNEPPADLVVVDGGAGQVSAAREVLTRFGHHATELLGLAKREELIYRERGEPPLRLPRSSAALQLLQRVRDEAHRFAISYHRLLRDQRTTASALDGIPGIGRVKKLALLHHFGTVEAIREATAAQLCEVRGLNQRDVERLLAYWAGQKARP
jgi:excinuclease ABC subunit C